MENEKPLYSLDKIKEIDDAEDFIQQVIQIFLETVPPNTEAMVKACAQEDWDQVYFFAHKIKSNINLLSIDSIIEDVRFVEQSAKNRVNVEMIEEKVKFIEGVLERVKDEIKAHLPMP